MFKWETQHDNKQGNFQMVIFQNQFSNSKYLDHTNEQGKSERQDQP